MSATLPNDERVALLSRRSKEFIKASSSWLYPFKGIYYLLSHPFLWPIVRARFLPCFILSVVVLVVLFLFTYLPQVAFLAIFQGIHLAWFHAAILVLEEGSLIVAILFEAFFVDEALVEIVDSILIHEGFVDLVATRRNINHDGQTPLAQLGKPTQSANYSPFSMRLILEYFILLPLNFIPFVGTALFLIIVGRRAGPFHHFRYLKLRGMHEKERKVWWGKRTWTYTWFGSVALGLQLIPVLSMFFLLSTATGSAVWATHLEEERRSGEDA